MAALLLVAAAALVAAALRSAPSRGFALLAGVVVLVPADLVVPNGLTPLPTFVRVTALAVGAGLLLRRKDAWAVTPVHLVAAAYALTTLVTGVLLAPRGLRLRDAAYDWVSLVEPLLVFVVALGALRAAADDRLAVRVLARVTAVAVVLALLERLTGGSWGELVGSAGGALEQRLGEVRVRAGAEFALALAWTLAALVPAALVAARRRGVGAEVAVVAGCLLGAYWTFSRSAPLAFAVGLAVLVVAGRDRRTALGAVVATSGLLAVALAVPAIGSRFTPEVDLGALAVRTERLPVVLGAAAQRPFSGTGLSGTALVGVPTTDNSYLRVYAETGAAGAAVLLVALAVALVCAGRGLATPPGPARSTCAAAVAGAAVLVAGGLAFDALQVRGTADLLWLLLAVGVASSERAAGPVRLLRPWTDAPRARVGLVAGALVVGTAATLAWPTHTAVTARFETLPAERLTGAFDPVAEGRRLVTTVCGVADLYDLRDDGVRLDCRDLNGPAGVGELRAQAGDAERATAVLGDVAGLVRGSTRVAALRLSQDGPARTGRPTLVRTAPLWLPLAVLLLVLVVPSAPLQRLERRLAGPGGGARRVHGQHVGAGLPRPVGASAGVAQRGDERGAEAVPG